MSFLGAAARLGLISAIALTFVACGKQGIGERCDPANGDADCEAGLECLRGNDLATVSNDTALCCPPGGGRNNCDVDTLPSFDADVPPAPVEAGPDGAPGSGGAMPDGSTGSGGATSTPDADVSDAAGD